MKQNKLHQSGLTRNTRGLFIRPGQFSPGKQIDPYVLVINYFRLVVLAPGHSDGRPCLHSISRARLHSAPTPTCPRLTPAFSRANMGARAARPRGGTACAPSASHATTVGGCHKWAHCNMCNTWYIFETSRWKHLQNTSEEHMKHLKHASQTLAETLENTWKSHYKIYATSR
jgi:hypothetical protein